MTRYAIDAPTLVHLVTAEIDVNRKHQLVAPHLIRSHALDLLLTAVRRGEMERELALRLQERIVEVKIRLLGDRVSRRTALKFALERNWETTSDAEYLAVAQLQADALVTVDARMAALADGIVPVESVQALLDEN